MKHFVRLLIFLFPMGVQAQFDLSFFELPPRSKFNQAILTLPDSNWSYDILTGGHLYGAHENERSTYPSSSFLAHAKVINGLQPQAFIATGDLIRSARDAASIDAWKTAGDLINAPIYNAPGNHDLDDRKAYEQAFGPTQYSFFVRDDYFLLLDTEHLREGTAKSLRSFVKKEATKIRNRIQPIRHLFVFSHRMLAPICDPVNEALEDFANESFRDEADRETACEIFDLVGGIPHQGAFWWFSGDVGTHWSVPALYGFNQQYGCHLAAGGLGDTPQDRLLKIRIPPQGNPKVTTFPLFPGGKAEAIEEFTPSYWESVREQAEEAPSQGGNAIGQLLKQESFWLGIALGALAGLLMALILRRIKRKSPA